MHDNALNGNTSLLEDVPCAIVPSQFVRSWRQWILRPGEAPRPAAVDNSQFICEHGLLAFDPNASGDIDTSMAIVKRTDWAAVEEMYVHLMIAYDFLAQRIISYTGGPLIAIEKTGDTFMHEINVCTECRLKR